MLIYIQFKMLFQCPLILLPKILLFLSLTRISAINLLLISLHCKNCLFIFQPILCKPCKDLPSYPVAVYVFLRVFGGGPCRIHGKVQVSQTKISPICVLLVILQEPSRFVEHNFPLQSCIEFLPMYLIYLSSLRCIVTSTKFIKLTRL